MINFKLSEEEGFLNATDLNRHHQQQLASQQQPYKDPTDLRRRFIQVFHQDSVLWLAIPFLEGLLYAGDLMNRRVFIPGSSEPFPLLTCLTQYKLLKKQFQYNLMNSKKNIK